MLASTPAVASPDPNGRESVESGARSASYVLKKRPMYGTT